MKIYDYKQQSKNMVRHTILKQAVNQLTVERENSCCVPRTYVRNVIDHFLSKDEDAPVKKETLNIDLRYCSDWESLHDSVVVHKRPSDLSVCYLSGPQPENDFEELTSLGILPQNIWAFENNKENYLEAVYSYNSPQFPQPKIVKMSLEQFFKQSPKKFDIIYIDACGSIPSSQHALRSVATLCQYQRLNSPGVLITNFSSPDTSKEHILVEYTKLISLYHVFKENPNIQVKYVNNELSMFGMDEIYDRIKNNFNYYYGEFISYLLTDIPSVIIPLQRFASIAQYSNLFQSNPFESITATTTIEEINSVQNNSISKLILMFDFLCLRSDRLSEYSKVKVLCTEIIGINGNWEELVRGVKAMIGLKNTNIMLLPQVAEIISFFNNSKNLYQFLDRPTDSLFFDMVINQLTYPLHSNNNCCRRYNYCAKQTDMFTDLTILDECRYLYEWLPALHQIKNAMLNKSWQYIFRFALDGLVKQRLKYNNEFFFQGSVIDKSEYRFEAKKRKERIFLEG